MLSYRALQTVLKMPPPPKLKMVALLVSITWVTLSGTFLAAKWLTFLMFCSLVPT